MQFKNPYSVKSNAIYKDNTNKMGFRLKHDDKSELSLEDFMDADTYTPKQWLKGLIVLRGQIFLDACQNHASIKWLWLCETSL